MNLQRQTDLVSSSELESIPIVIVGAGSIGSYTTLALTKMGAGNVTVFDFDELNDYNVPNQFYKISQVGQKKVEALRDNIFEMTDTMIKTESRRFTPADAALAAGGILISAVDNMATRKMMFESIDPKTARFIDARMAALTLEVYSVRPDNKEDKEAYNKRLFTSDKALQVPCTSKGIIFPVMTCASLITSIVRKVIAAEGCKRRYIINFKQDHFITID